MEYKNHKLAKIFILIPIIVFAATSACLVPMAVSYFSTGSDPAAVALIFLVIAASR